jgi:hypothetical protein
LSISDSRSKESVTTVFFNTNNLGVVTNITLDELFLRDMNPIVIDIIDDFFDSDFTASPSPDFSVNVDCPYNTLFGGSNIGLFSWNLLPFSTDGIWLSDVIDTNSLIDLVMDVNHPNLGVTSVEVLDHVGVIELVPTGSHWVLVRVTDSSAGSFALESKDLSVLSNRDVGPGTGVNEDWFEVTFGSVKILGVSLVIEFSGDIGHPDLASSTAGNFVDTDSGWVLGLPASSNEVLVHRGGHNARSEDDFVVRSDSPNVSGSTDSDGGTFLVT